MRSAAASPCAGRFTGAGRGRCAIASVRGEGRKLNCRLTAAAFRAFRVAVFRSNDSLVAVFACVANVFVDRHRFPFRFSSFAHYTRIRRVQMHLIKYRETTNGFTSGAKAQFSC